MGTHIRRALDPVQIARGATHETALQTVALEDCDCFPRDVEDLCNSKKSHGLKRECKGEREVLVVLRLSVSYNRSPVCCGSLAACTNIQFTHPYPRNGTPATTGDRLHVR